MIYSVNHLPFEAAVPVCSEPDINQAKHWGEQYADEVLGYAGPLDWRKISDTMWILTHGGVVTDVILTATPEPAAPRPQTIVSLPQ